MTQDKQKCEKKYIKIPKGFFQNLRFHIKLKRFGLPKCNCYLCQKREEYITLLCKEIKLK